MILNNNNNNNSKNKIKYVGKKQCLINCSLAESPPLSSDWEGGGMIQ